MSDALIALAGTPEGARLATLLALMSAFAHALFGALQKGRHDPWTTRGAIDAWIFVLSLPVALFLVPWPEGQVWWLLGGALILHMAYKVVVALSYARAPYTVSYPIVRGTGPLVTVAVAAVVFSEHYGWVQWAGVALLSGAIFALAAVNLSVKSVDTATLRVGIAWAVLGGILVALYTTYDAVGIRATANPFTFLAWFFLITSIDMPVIAWVRQRGKPPVPPGLMLKGVAGALIAFFSFGGVMLATYLDKVGEAAVLRETSTVFAALIGWLLLGERVGRARAALMALIAAGAVLVELGG